MGKSLLEKIENKNVIILGAFLGLEVLGKVKPALTCIIASEAERELLPSNVHFIADNCEKKANLTINIVMNALKRNFDIHHIQNVR